MCCDISVYCVLRPNLLPFDVIVFCLFHLYVFIFYSDYLGCIVEVCCNFIVITSNSFSSTSFKLRETVVQNKFASHNDSLVYQSLL